MSIKNILISQPEPKVENSPYNRLINKQKVKINFKSFIQVEPINSRSLREQQIKLSDFTSVIFTSRNSVDHFFRVANEMRFKPPSTFRYFCQSEAIAFYLQKYIVYRKRKIYVGQKLFEDLIPYFKKYSTERYFVPSSDVLKEKVPKVLDELGVDWYRGVLYKTVSSDLRGVLKKDYDLIVFFTPSGIDSLFKNYPEFTQQKVKIATYGNSTLLAAEKAGLNVDIIAPSKEIPSMSMALERYISTHK